MDEQPRLLVFGASGLLGRNIVQWAHSTGDIDVHATHLHGAIAHMARAEWHQIDILDHGAVVRLVDAVRPTWVINSAYRQSGDHAEQICSSGAATVAVAAADVGARVVHLSTDLVFDGTLGRPYVEADPVSPISAYGRAKAEAEERVLDSVESASVIRTSLIYGVSNAPQETLVRRAASEGNIAFFIDEWRSPASVTHLASAVGEVTLSSHRGILHLAGDERMDRLSFARALAPGLGIDPATLVGRTQDPDLGPRAQDVSLDCSMSHSFGWRIPGPTEVFAQS